MKKEEAQKRLINIIEASEKDPALKEFWEKVENELLNNL